MAGYGRRSTADLQGDAITDICSGRNPGGNAVVGLGGRDRADQLIAGRIVANLADDIDRDRRRGIVLGSPADRLDVANLEAAAERLDEPFLGVAVNPI